MQTGTELAPFFSVVGFRQLSALLPPFSIQKNNNVPLFLLPQAGIPRLGFFLHGTPNKEGHLNRWPFLQ
jgi:hypothetical protein